MRRRLILVCLLFGLAVERGRGAGAPADSEEPYRANNRGVALLEQFRSDDAAKEFRRALELDPRFGLARVNLAIALYDIPEPAGAERGASAALEASPDSPQAHFVLGLVARSQDRGAEAEAHFRKVLAYDAQDVGALVNLGQLQMQQRQF